MIEYQYSSIIAVRRCQISEAVCKAMPAAGEPDAKADALAVLATCGAPVDKAQATAAATAASA